MDITLLINYFNHPNTSRRDEFIYCLNKNNDNPLITKVIVFVDGLTDYQFIRGYDKFTPIQYSGRASYKDFFEYANTYNTGMTIVSNLDIYFDNTLEKLSNYNFDNTVLALSRTDLISTCSQDAWIFKTQLNTAGFDCDFHLGNPGCDNRIAYELHKNYDVINACFQIKIHHMHQSSVRTTQEGTISKPYYFPVIS